jgi:hypothetical protein
VEVSLAELFFGRLPVAVATSLRDEPEAWRDSHDDNPFADRAYRLVHRNGTELWVGNRAYGIQVNVPGCRKWGDVTVLSSIALSPGHHLIWRAASRWLVSHGYTATGERRGPRCDATDTFLAGAAQ